MPDSVLLLALPRAYRTRQTDAFARIAGELASRLGLSVEPTDIPSLLIIVETTDIQPVEIPVATTDIQPVEISVEPTDIPTDPIPVEPTDIQPSIIPVVTTDIPGPSKDKAARDRRIMELAGIPERRASEILAAEGYAECSARTVSNVRKRLNP